MKHFICPICCRLPGTQLTFGIPEILDDSLIICAVCRRGMSLIPCPKKVQNLKREYFLTLKPESR